MQACPYDAIYLDPNDKTVAKCHYCSHRTEIGLEPACVVVCPTHSIIAGDLNDANAPISQLVAQHETQVRKPEQGTIPNLFYIEGHEPSLNPLSDNDAPSAFMWSDVISEQGMFGAHSIGEGRVAEQMVQVGYNAQHKAALALAGGRLYGHQRHFGGTVFTDGSGLGFGASSGATLFFGGSVHHFIFYVGDHSFIGG